MMKQIVCELTLLVVLLAPACWAQGVSQLQFLPLNSTPGVETTFVGHFDDGASHSILVPGPGLPFGNSRQRHLFINTNGIMSFREPFYSAFPQAFPGTSSSVSNAYLVAPFWEDVDIRNAGNIYYETHDANNSRSSELLAQVSGFVSNQTGTSFSGTWMTVAFWDQVHPFPHGLSPTFYSFLIFAYPDLHQENTFQAIIITDLQNTTYTVFTYRCGSMGWARQATIGYNAAGDVFENHRLTGSLLSPANTIACANSPSSVWSNVVYKISIDSPNITTPLPTIEPDQDSYLQFLTSTNNRLTVPMCQNCSAQINLTSPFPFGSYYHDTAYVNTKGVISFGEEFPYSDPAEFPTEVASTRFKYTVAPYWSNIDTRLDGQVWYETHQSGSSADSNQLLSRVGAFITNQTGVDFTGSWMLVAMWDTVHPFPHGASVDEDRQDPYLQSTNTFQAIVITNGTKSYAVFTYMCNLVEWSDEAGIGFNAAGEFYANHPLSGQFVSNAIDCVHQPDSIWNNVIYDLVPGSVMSGATPEPPTTVGSCVAAGYDTCCSTGTCFGTPRDCYCDLFCASLGDCCVDQPDICATEEPASNGTYLLFGNHVFLNRVSPDGTGLQVLATDRDGNIVGVDYDYRRGYFYWSDVLTDTIYRANMNDTSNPVVLVNTSTDVVDDIALDWVGNTLYWTDALYARIEVLDLDTMERAELFHTGANTIPRAIIVDPGTRYMYWTDWGTTAKIERASMDGQNRMVLHNTLLVWPNGITIDYAAQRLYWTDAFLDRIEYSGVDGTGRQVLVRRSNGILHPFSITLENDLLFWSDWTNDSIFATHKLDGSNIFTVYHNLLLNPNGIEAVTPDRQILTNNTCSGSGCSHICLLSAVRTEGFTCMCPDGFPLGENDKECNLTVSPPPIPRNGTCVAAGYSSCCSGGYCRGNPPTCYCDASCSLRGDCCSDISITCPSDRGSCRAAGYTGCCPFATDPFGCSGEPPTCYCDTSCQFFGDCCYDFAELCLGTPTTPPTTATPTPTASTTTPTSTTPTNTTTPTASTTTPTASTTTPTPTSTTTPTASTTTPTPTSTTTPTASTTTPTPTSTTTPTASTTTPTPTSTTPTVPPAQPFLPFLNLSVTPGVSTVYLGRFDDGASHAIQIQRGVPFGNSTQSFVFVGTNGIISFRDPFYVHTPYPFPGPFSDISAAYIVAPFWSDIDLRMAGNVFYQVVTQEASQGASNVLMQVSDFVSEWTNDDFSGTWMLVAMWDQVHPYPHGDFPSFYPQTNTFQAIVITNHTTTYTVFTYRCGSMEWPNTFANNVTIGYNGGSSIFFNHPRSGFNARSIACVNSPAQWSNLVYKLSIESYTTMQPPTVEPDQAYYLPFISESAGNLKTFSGCDDCNTAAINFTRPFAFGSEQEYTAYIGTNGIVAFREAFPHYRAVLFPTNFNSAAYVVAPYWADADARLEGEIRYEIFYRDCNTTSNRLLDRVGTFIMNETGVEFTGTWMMVVTWYEMHPWPHGRGLYDAYVNSTNTFQAILITNGTKSYAVFTYMCNLIEWSDAATIGFDAGGEFYANHPLSGQFVSNAIDCVHQPDSVWNNVIYDLVPWQLNLTASTPSPSCPTVTLMVPSPTKSTAKTPAVSPPTKSIPAISQSTAPTPAVSRPTKSIPAVSQSAAPTPAVSRPTIHTPAIPTPTQSTIPTQPPSAPPGSVQNINTMRVTADVTRLIVSWEVPAVTNGQLISHQVVVTHWINGRMTTVYNETVSRSTFTVNITGLQRYIPYYISIRASNAAGYGEAETAVAFTEEGTPTAPPTNIATERLNSTHMNVTWMPISLEEARGFITNYTVIYGPAPSTGGPQKRDHDQSSVTVKSAPAVIGGLSPNVVYSVTVRANTAAGMGVVSEPTTVSVPSVSPPGQQGGLSSGGTAGVVIAVIGGVAMLLIFITALIYIWWKKPQFKDESYAVFQNDQESVHIDGGASDVEDEKPMIGAELASEKKGVLAFSTSPDTSGTVTTSYRPLGEELAAFSNPMYDTMGLDDSQALVQSSAMDTTYAVVDERPKAAQFKKLPPDYESVKQSREENPYVLDPMHKN